MAKIFIVDDSESVRSQLKQLLEKAGYTVVEANDGDQGFQVISTSTPDLIITDYNMPGSDGITMLEKLKTAGKLNCPVFMLTTESSQQLKTAGKAAGVRAWIVKPFNEAKLLSAIERILSM